MNRAMWAALLAACAIGSAVLADEDVSAKVKALVADLASDDCETRSRASEALVAIGAPAEHALEECLASTDAEVRARAQGALAAIRLERKIGPSAWITLPEKETTVLEALLSLARQANRNIDATGVQLGGKSFHEGGRVPFWRALDDLCLAGGCHYEPNFAEGIVLRPEPMDKVPHCYQGPFRVSIPQITLVRTSMTATGAIDAETDANLLVQWEPHVRPRSIDRTPNIEEAVDDKGQSMLPGAKKDPSHDFAQAEPAEDSPIPSRESWAVLGAPSAGARAIRLLKGSFDVVYLVDQAELLFDAKEREKGETKSADPVHAKVESWTRQGARATAKLVVSGLGQVVAATGGPPGAVGDGSELVQFFLRDAGGKDRSHGEMSGITTTDGDDRSEYEVTFPEVPDGAFQLGITVVTKTLLRPVRFEFHDIPLP